MSSSSVSVIKNKIKNFLHGLRVQEYSSLVKYSYVLKWSIEVMSLTLPVLLPLFPLLSLLSCSKEQCQKLQIRGGSYHCFRKLSSEISGKKEGFV